MKRIFKYFLSGVVALSMCTAAIGASALDYSLSYMGGDSEIIIEGISAVKKAGRSITLQIIKEGSVIDYSIPSSAEQAFIYTRQTLTDADGLFEFSFNLDQSGKHTVRISDNGESVDDSKTICASTNSALSDTLSDVSAAKGNPNLLDAVINSASDITPSLKNYEILQINKFQYDSLKSDESFLVNLSSKEYADFNSFNKQYKLSKLLVDVSRASSGEAVFNLLNEGDTLIPLTTKNAGSIYEAYSEATKKNILNTLVGNHYSSAISVQNAVYEAVIVKEIALADTSEAKFNVISANNDYIALNLTKLSNLGSYIETFKTELSKKDLSSVSKIKSAYESLYTYYSGLSGTTSFNPGPGVSSSPSGSTGSSSTVGVDTSLMQGSSNTLFSDIASVSWAKEAIESLAARGVISGKAQGIFAPNDNITRAEFVKILVGAFSLTDANSNASFADVPQSHWAYKYIATASSKGIVNGIGNGMFGTDSNITRQDIAVLCYRLALSKGVSFASEGEFADVSVISDYAKEAASKLKGAGIINGKESNYFDPSSFATRAEAAKIIYQLMLYCQR